MSGWVRLWHDMPTDPKWRVIARKSGQRVGDVIAVFSFLMVSASANADERGRTQGVVCEDIGAALDLSEDDVNAIIKAMTGKVMDAEGYLTGWEKRQPKREDSSAERAKRWRDERKRTQANASERAEIDSDAEIDRKKEKVSPSPKKGTRLPVEWSLPEEGYAFAKSLRMSLEEINHEADQFRDFWISKPGAGGCKLDWPATWRTWCRNRRGAGQAGKPAANGNGSKPLGMAGILAERRRQAGNPDDVSTGGGVLQPDDGLSGIWINPSQSDSSTSGGGIRDDAPDLGQVRGMGSGASRGNGSPW